MPRRLAVRRGERVSFFVGWTAMAAAAALLRVDDVRLAVGDRLDAVSQVGRDALGGARELGRDLLDATRNFGDEVELGGEILECLHARGGDVLAVEDGAGKVHLLALLLPLLVSGAQR